MSENDTSCLSEIRRAAALNRWHGAVSEGLEAEQFQRKEQKMNPSNKQSPLGASGRCPAPPLKRKRKDSVAEILLCKHLDELGLTWQREWHFHSERRWRFDFAVCLRKDVNRLVAIEIEGGAWIAGRHTRGKGFEDDIRKYNQAAKLGWTVIRFTPNMIERAEDKTFLAELFGRKA